MHLRLYDRLSTDAKPKIKKLSAMLGSADSVGAFPRGDKIDISVLLPRRLAIVSAEINVTPDREGEKEQVFSLRLAFDGLEGSDDRYSVTLDTDMLASEYQSRLFFYYFTFKNADGESFIGESLGNVDISIEAKKDAELPFCLSLYEEGFKTPGWLGRGVMYQIFVDRFAKGEGEVTHREDAVFDPDWYDGIPQFAPSKGQPVKNNVFFGGNLWGVCEKIPYLRSLGVTVIYLCPIFEAYSNHKYDTGDYLKIDGMFGGEAAFEKLVAEAKAAGIKIILDGVFNHTGDDSKYFNRYGRYDSLGAYQSQDSEYFDWYNFKEWNSSYEAWWGIEILPRLDHSNEKCRAFFTGKGGVAEKYIKMGVGGWRLDVADELSDTFLDEFRATVKRASRGNAAIIGEVWENAALKSSYGKRRRYFDGKQLDSVMNYPLRSAIIDYMRFGDGEILASTLNELWSTYPRTVCDCLMNIVGTHDTDRILTVLSGYEDRGEPSEEVSRLKMSEEQRLYARKLLMAAATVQYTVFGIPCLYYGDEAGMEGAYDPFCRRPYPWGKEDDGLLEHYRRLGQIREKHKAYDRGDFKLLQCKRGLVAYERVSLDGKDRLITAVNVGDGSRGLSAIIKNGSQYEDLLTGTRYGAGSRLLPDTAVILSKIGD